MADFFSDLTLNVLFRSLDANALNHLLIANNIANVNTPGFRRSEVSFKQGLKDALETKRLKGARTNPLHLPIGSPDDLEEVEPRIVTDEDTVMRADQNNVDVDKEMANLASNSMEYQALTHLVAQKFRLILAAIEGR